VNSKIYAPWTAAQVRALRAWQTDGDMHPYTCPHRGDGRHRVTSADLGALIPTRLGWYCPDCGYSQTWAFKPGHWAR
jgi:hypothetical protein